MTVKELWYVRIECKWVTAGNINFIDFRFCLPDATHKPIRVSPKMLTAMRHAHSKRITARRSEIKHQIYMLLYCHTPITLTPHEFEADTSTVLPNGEVAPPSFTLYKYFLQMLQEYVKEVADESKLR